jgi:hypothetical protein
MRPLGAVTTAADLQINRRPLSKNISLRTNVIALSKRQRKPEYEVAASMKHKERKA